METVTNATPHDFYHSLPASSLSANAGLLALSTLAIACLFHSFLLPRFSGKSLTCWFGVEQQVVIRENLNPVGDDENYDNDDDDDDDDSLGSDASLRGHAYYVEVTSSFQISIERILEKRRALIDKNLVTKTLGLSTGSQEGSQLNSSECVPELSWERSQSDDSAEEEGKNAKQEEQDAQQSTCSKLGNQASSALLDSLLSTPALPPSQPKPPTPQTADVTRPLQQQPNVPEHDRCPDPTVVVESSSAPVVSDRNLVAGITTMESDCAICLMKLEDGATIAMSRYIDENEACRHVFHHACLVEWLLKHDDCPCCRRLLVRTHETTTSE